MREFVTLAAEATGIDLAWEGSGVDEVARDRATGKVIVRVDQNFFRPTEVHILRGNPAKAENTLHWTRKIGFGELVELMVDADLRRAVAHRPSLDGATAWNSESSRRARH